MLARMLLPQSEWEKYEFRRIYGMDTLIKNNLKRDQLDLSVSWGGQTNRLKHLNRFLIYVCLIWIIKPLWTIEVKVPN